MAISEALILTCDSHPSFICTLHNTIYCRIDTITNTLLAVQRIKEGLNSSKGRFEGSKGPSNVPPINNSAETGSWNIAFPCIFNIMWKSILPKKRRWRRDKRQTLGKKKLAKGVEKEEGKHKLSPYVWVEEGEIWGAFFHVCTHFSIIQIYLHLRPQPHHHILISVQDSGLFVQKSI